MTNLLNRFREVNAETVKRIGTVALAGALLVGGTTGCAGINNTSNDPSIGGITGSEDNGKYSNLLMSVVNDEHYKSIMSGTSVQNYDIPAFDPHPYAFLQDQGIDINKILDGTYKAKTMTFVYDDEPNNLYMNTRILIDDSYYQAYLITYTLSDKEMADYKMVHGDKSHYSYSWPAFFINDAISATKQPTEVLSTKYTKKTHERFEKHAAALLNEPNEYAIPSIDLSDSSYIYLRYPLGYSTEVAVYSKTILVGKFKYSGINNSNGIYEIANTYNYAQLLEKQKRQATTFDLRDAIIFRSQNVTLMQD